MSAESTKKLSAVAQLKATEGLLSEADVLRLLSEHANNGSVNALTALLRWYREHEEPDDAPQDAFSAIDAAAGSSTLRKVA